VRLRQLDSARLDGKTEHLADLAQENTERNTIQIADQDGLGEEVRQKPEPEKPCSDTREAREHSKDHRQREVGVGVAASKRCDNGRHHDASGRIRVYDQLPRGAEQGVGEQRQDARIETNHRIEPGELGVGDGGRQCHGRH